MNVSSTLAGYLEPYGIWWPEGDGDALRDLASAWGNMATFLSGLATTLDGAADELAGAQAGDAAARFSAYWAAWSGPDGYLARAIDYCGRLASALELFASDVEIADSELASMVEAALGPSSLMASALPAATIAQIANASGQIAASLGTAATQASSSAGIPSMAPLEPLSVGGPNPITLDQAQVPDFTPGSLTSGIPDPGPAPDFSSLATATVDFGNGTGRPRHGRAHTAAQARPAAPAPTPAKTAPAATAKVAGAPAKVPSPTTAKPATPAPTPAAPTPAAPTPAVASPAAFTPAPLPATVAPTVAPSISIPTSTPVHVPAPTSHLPAVAKTAAAGLGAGAVAATRAVATKAGKSSTIPFFPMGGMFGSAMGDDSEDGKRRRRVR